MVVCDIHVSRIWYRFILSLEYYTSRIFRDSNFFSVKKKIEPFQFLAKTGCGKNEEYCFVEMGIASFNIHLQTYRTIGFKYTCYEYLSMNIDVLFRPK